MLSLIDAMRQQGAERPNKLFIRSAADSLTYGQFLDAVRRCAAGFDRMGVREGDRVAVMMRNRLEHVVLVYGLKWINAVHVPVSVHLKSAGLGLQLEDVRPRFLIADSEFSGVVADAAAATGVHPEIIWNRPESDLRSSGWDAQRVLETSSGDVDVAWHDLDRLDQISYTSGTTGPPKGAKLTDRYLQLGAHSATNLASLDEADNLLLWEPLYHGGGWTAIYSAMLNGATVSMVEKFSASRCWDQVRDLGCTRLHYLGAVVNLLLKQPVRSDDSDNPVQIAWGAACPRDSWEIFEERFGLEVREGYGLTEGADFALLNIDGPVGSMGKPIAEFDAWVEASPGVPAHQGDAGELVLKPREDRLTMAGFFRNGSATQSVLGSGVVRTGDLAKQDSAGYFYFAGRVTDSLRRRGENVSAWEVERVVEMQPGVVEAAVIGVPSLMGEEDIKLFVRLETGSAVSEREIVAWCADRLAYYQVPRFVEIVTDFPRGATQRIQKSQLSRDLTNCYDVEAVSR